MTGTIAESLAQEVDAGTYTPSFVVDCNLDLPIDRNPQVVRFTQFVLFATPTLDVRSPAGPAFLILQQYEPNDRGRESVIKRVIKPLAAALPSLLRGASLSPAASVEALPDPNDSGVKIERLRALAVERGMPGYHPRLSASEVRARYKGWFGEQARSSVLRMLEPLRRAGFSAHAMHAFDWKKLPDVFEGVLTDALLPGPYQPFENPHPHFAL